MAILGFRQPEQIKKKNRQQPSQVTMKTACCRIKTTDSLEDAAIVLLLIKNIYELDFGFDVFVYKFKTGSKVSNVISTFPTLLR